MDCLMSLECATKYAPAYMVYLGISTIIVTIIGGTIMFVFQLVQFKQMKKSKTLEEELEGLKTLPPLPKEEQEMVDMLAKAMAEQAIEDLAHGICYKPAKRKR